MERNALFATTSRQEGIASSMRINHGGQFIANGVLILLQDLH